MSSVLQTNIASCIKGNLMDYASKFHMEKERTVSTAHEVLGSHDLILKYVCYLKNLEDIYTIF